MGVVNNKYCAIRWKTEFVYFIITVSSTAFKAYI